MQLCDNEKCNTNDGQGVCCPDKKNVMLDDFEPPLCDCYIDPNQDISEPGAEQDQRARREKAARDN